jgi:hypothetical protein
LLISHPVRYFECKCRPMFWCWACMQIQGFGCPASGCQLDTPPCDYGDHFVLALYINEYVNVCAVLPTLVRYKGGLTISRASVPQACKNCVYSRVIGMATAVYPLPAQRLYQHATYLTHYNTPSVAGTRVLPFAPLLLCSFTLMASARAHARFEFSSLTGYWFIFSLPALSISVSQTAATCYVR